MKFQKLAAISAFLSVAVLASGAFAEDTSGHSWPHWPHWLQTDAQPSQQGGMCSAGGAGQCGGANQNSAAQAGGSEGDCPMMRKTAGLEQRVRELEQRLQDVLDTAQPSASVPAKPN
jgi:hypothetical protein